MRTHLFLLLFLFSACNSRINNSKDISQKRKIQISGRYIICDTCSSTLIVHHDECTSCGEISVDSGVVYIPKRLLSILDTLQDHSDQSDTAMIPHDLISLRELYFSEGNDFNKLWSDSINYSDFYKPYRVTGNIVEVKHRILSNCVIESSPSFFLKLKKATEIDTSYLKSLR